MRNFISDLQNFTTHRGLHCVWLLAREGDRTRLTARWVAINQESSAQHEDKHESGVFCVCDEGREPIPGRHSHRAKRLRNEVCSLNRLAASHKN